MHFRVHGQPVGQREGEPGFPAVGEGIGQCRDTPVCLYFSGWGGVTHRLAKGEGRDQFLVAPDVDALRVFPFIGHEEHIQRNAGQRVHVAGDPTEHRAAAVPQRVGWKFDGFSGKSARLVGVGGDEGD